MGNHHNRRHSAGFGLASWAPLVPFAKSRLDVEDGTLGRLLLCLGVGSVLAMALTGMLNARFGSKPLVVTGLVMAIGLPFLAVAPTPITLDAALFVFGAGLGALDVAMNMASGLGRLKAATRMTRYGGERYAMAMVAAGQIDLAIEPSLQPYDIVALIPIIEQAGGVVTRLDGKRAGGGGLVLLSANAALHDLALRCLADGEGPPRLRRTWWTFWARCPLVLEFGSRFRRE